MRAVALRRLEQGDLLGALAAYRYAADLAQLRRDHQWRGLLLGEMADLYQRERAPQLARSLYQDALACFERSGDLARRDQMLLGLAQVAQRLGVMRAFHQYSELCLGPARRRPLLGPRTLLLVEAFGHHLAQLQLRARLQLRRHPSKCPRRHWDISPQQSLGLRWIDYQGKGYWRLAYRRAVIRGIDIYAVFNKEPDTPHRFVVKLVRSLR